MEGNFENAEINYRWKNIVIMLAICIFALIIILMSDSIQTDATRHITKSIGESLLVGGLLGFMLEFVLRQDFLKIIFSIRDSIDRNKKWEEVSKQPGLVSIHKSDKTLDIESLLHTSNKITIIMNDGRTWLSNHEAQIEKRLAQNGRETIVYLIHPESPYLISLARKVSDTPSGLIIKMEESIRMLKKYQRNGHKLTVYGHFLPASYSLVHTEKYSCQIPYPIGRKVEKVPVLVFGKTDGVDGVYDSIVRDIETIKQHSFELFPNKQAVME